MNKYFKTSIGRLRIAGLLEGVSLIVLMGIGMPLKYFFDSPEFVKTVGPIHGALFVLFIVLMVGIATEHKWNFKTIALVVVSCFIPFGTIYVDKTILSKLHRTP